jgi:hypothetical protein
MSTRTFRARPSRALAVAVGAILAGLVNACAGYTSPGQGSSFTKSLGWTCANGVNCQDVFDFQLTAGTKVSFKVSNVSSGSVVEVALYGPGVALGGTDLFTGDTTELLCGGDLTSCSNNTAGQDVESFAIPQTGTYRFAVTRNWSHSCSATGTYDMSVTSASSFQANGQTVEDAPSLAPGPSCPAK